MTKFITEKDLTVNLSKCASIGFNASKKRIVFNMSHSIETYDTRLGKHVTIADYKYFDYDTIKEFDEAKKIIEEYSNFLRSTYDNHYLVNPVQISYINIDKNNNRIIFNLAVSVTKKTTGFLTNDFIFWTFNSKEDLLSNINLLVDRGIL